MNWREKLQILQQSEPKVNLLPTARPEMETGAVGAVA